MGPSKKLGAVTHFFGPLFNHALCTFFFRVGLCSHGISLFQVTWPHRTHQIQARTLDRVDPSPRDHPSKHVLKKEIEGLPGETWSRQERLIVIAIPSCFSGRGFIRRLRSFTIPGSGSTAWNFLERWISIRWSPQVDQGNHGSRFPRS